MGPWPAAPAVHITSTQTLPCTPSAAAHNRPLEVGLMVPTTGAISATTPGMGKGRGPRPPARRPALVCEELAVPLPCGSGRRFSVCILFIVSLGSRRALPTL